MTVFTVGMTKKSFNALILISPVEDAMALWEVQRQVTGGHLKTLDRTRLMCHKVQSGTEQFPANC